MNAPNRFRAPWSGLLIALSVGATLVLVGASWVCLQVLPEQPGWARLVAAALPLAIVLGCLPFAIRGYALTGRDLIIERLGWSSRWPLAELRAVTVDPEAMRRSIRLCGNGGLFAFCGWFRNRKLGVYRAFVTDPKRSVVLQFRRRTIVVTPEDPEQFAAEVRRHLLGQL